MSHSGDRLKILVLSRNYPNNVLEGLGLWVKRLVCTSAQYCDITVISPVPYVPPLPLPQYYGRFRQIPKTSSSDGIRVFYPRFLVGPGKMFHYTEAVMYYFAIRSLVSRLRTTFPFDLIHAHFPVPDGLVASWLGRQYHVPVIITEHSLWRPGRMEQQPIMRCQAMRAVRGSTFQVAVSRAVKDSIVHFTGEPEKVRVISNGVDGNMFVPVQPGETRDLNQILYVGFLNFNKGIDLLLHAMRELTQRRPQLKLVLVGGSFYRNTRVQADQLKAMAHDFGLDQCVVFVGNQPPSEVARYMRESALLVLPSRGESFGSVLVEAMACGTPVVATRCGGPEDIIDESDGALVPQEDATALAKGIEQVLERRDHYRPDELRRRALERFSWDRVAVQTIQLYQEAIRTAEAMAMKTLSPMGATK